LRDLRSQVLGMLLVRCAQQGFRAVERGVEIPVVELRFLTDPKTRVPARVSASRRSAARASGATPPYGRPCLGVSNVFSISLFDVRTLKN
jgi:hypothetical protein